MTHHTPTITRIGHIALYVSDPETSADWYAEVLGMKPVAVAGEGPYRGGIFMSFGRSDHDIGLFKRGDTATIGAEFEHIGLELECGDGIDALRAFHTSLVRKNIRIHELLDHGVSKGIYFFDPDGHMLEVFYQQISGPAAIVELGKNQGMAVPFQFSSPSKAE